MGNPGRELLMNQIGTILAITLLVVIQGIRQCPAAQVWTGPKIAFSKEAFANPSQPANQDRITDNVWLTRENTRGLFNIKAEASYVTNISPIDTEWSFGTTADIGSLTFEDWRTAVGGNPPASIGQDMVVHLVTDDIFIDIEFLTWGAGSSSGGFFSYERSTEPSAGFDNNGIVDGLDFLKWQRGESPNPLSQSDLALWESQYGGLPPTGAVSAVPEPTTCTLALAALCLEMSRRRIAAR
jgi:hypothetical protein